ncbi:MAG: hypothetical protein ACLFV7_13250 [Phycisphaerae bacterium]
MKPTTAQDSTPGEGRSRRRWIRRALLGLAAVLLATAGWLVFRAGRAGGGSVHRLGDLLRYDGGDDKPPADRSRGDLVRDPLGEVGIRRLTEQQAPDLVDPPQGMARSFAMASPDGAVTVKYRGAVEQARAVEHYRTDLAAKGYELLQDTTPRPGRRLLVFEKAEGTVEVALRNPDGKGKITSILVIRRSR